MESSLKTWAVCLHLSVTSKKQELVGFARFLLVWALCEWQHPAGGVLLGTFGPALLVMYQLRPKVCLWGFVGVEASLIKSS